MNDAKANSLLSRSAVVLVRPQIPENIGAAARVISNMGLGRLIVVRPVKWDLKRMSALATRIGREVIFSRLEMATTLEEAVDGYRFVVGTTSRFGRFRRPTGLPGPTMTEAAELLNANRLALVFGPEKDGLGTAELACCHRLTYIPTVGEASSLNLAQAVMVMAYELRLAVLERCRAEAPSPVSGAEERLAASEDLRQMYQHLSQTMDLVDPDQHFNRQSWMNGFKRLFDRARLLPHEVKMIRGLCRKIGWAVEPRRDVR